MTRSLRNIVTMTLLTLLIGAGSATAQGEATTPSISAGDTAWVLMSAALVMLMIPGLALFYGGMVRQKNVVATLMQCFVILAVISLQWAILGYTLAFGNSQGGFIGGFNHLFLNGIGPADATITGTIPDMLFVVFQGMFAVITPALIVGAFAERFSFKALIVFSLLWATLVYDPVAHWVWGGGFLGEMGALDFAGGTVVHITAGVAALACVLYIGKRKGFGEHEMRPNSIPLTMLGAGLLWFGWFGFNAGSALAADGLAVSAFAATHLAAASGALAWAIVEWSRKGKASALGTAAGLVAGLVAITPASGFVTPMAAIILGLTAGVACYFAVALLKGVFRVDDSLDAFGVHGVGGIVGALGTGLFATLAVNAGGATGLFATDAGTLAYNAAGWDLVTNQFIAVAITVAYTFVVTLGILFVTDRLVGLRVRVSEEHEEIGLDYAVHGEVAYDFDVPVSARATRSEPEPATMLATSAVLPKKR